MHYIVRTVKPTITLYKRDSDEAYKTYSTGDDTNLLSYTFKRDIYSFSSSFSFSVRESESNIMNEIQMLDVVSIVENGKDKADFLGVVTGVTYNASVNGKKQITISGKGIEYLFEMYTISLDATAMQFTGHAANKDSIEKNFAANLSNKDKGLTIKSVLNTVFEEFKKIAEQLPGITSTTIGEMIDRWFKNDIFVVENDEEFRYPISSNILASSTVKYPEYIKNLLPEPVYELYGTVIDGKPKIICREVPFAADKWNNLRVGQIKSEYLTNYVFGKNCEEVYTAFFPLLEGSSLSPEFYKVKNTADTGYACSNVNAEKLKIYGYRALFCTFHGYKIGGTPEESVKTKFLELSEKMAKWYGNLDEMYNANFVMANVEDTNSSMPKLGGIAKWGDASFYVTGEEHSWSYGDTAKIEFQCERGGLYAANADFSPIKELYKVGGILCV